MTEQVVERTTRKTPLPWSRLAVRGLVVAGFAGGIWLLSGTAAHAAHAAPDSGPRTAPRAASSTGVVGRLLGALESTLAPAGHHHSKSSDITSVARSGRAVPPTVATQATAVRTGAATAPVMSVPLVSRPSGLLTPVLHVVDPVLAPVTDTLVPLTDTLAPVTGAVDRLVAPVVGTATGTWLGSDQPVANWLVPAPVHESAGVPAAPQPAGGRQAPQRHTAAHEATAHGRAARIGSTHLPILPRPAPLPAYPGSGLTGIPTSSVSLHDGGTAAVVHTVAVRAPAAFRRLSTVAEVEVRRLIAEAPTVSPD